MTSNDASGSAHRSLIESTSPANIQKASLPVVANAQLMPPSMGETISDSEELHCVRCHVSFQESKNHPKACTFCHNEAAEYTADRVLQDDGTVTVKLQCCQVEYDEETSPPELCVEAPHTTNCDEVLYGDEYDGTGNMDVAQCAWKGCFRGDDEDEDEDSEEDNEDEDED